VKSIDSAKVYLVTNTCERRWIETEEAYFELFDSWNDFKLISVEEMQLLPVGEIITEGRAARFAVQSSGGDVKRHSSCTATERITKQLELGMVDAQVQVLESYLQCLGYMSTTSAVDTSYTQETADAVALFQQTHSLVTLGFVEAATRGSLNGNPYPASASYTSNSLACTVSQAFISFLSIGDTSEEVRRLQSLLQCVGDFSPDRSTTGYFGPLTESAVTTFQSRSGIRPAGYVGPSTRASLNSYLISE
jgi:peptidoglycan hydrolase-like protein with peptidoglycan-binding domain